MKELEREEEELKNDNRFNEFNEQAELELLKKKYLREQEDKFEKEREATKRKYAE